MSELFVRLTQLFDVDFFLAVFFQELFEQADCEILTTLKRFWRESRRTPAWPLYDYFCFSNKITGFLEKSMPTRPLEASLLKLLHISVKVFGKFLRGFLGRITRSEEDSFEIINTSSKEFLEN